MLSPGSACTDFGMSELLTPREIDALLRYPRGRAIKLAKAGQLPAVILPDGEIRFARDAIEAWLYDRSTHVENEGGRE